MRTNRTHRLRHAWRSALAVALVLCLAADAAAQWKPVGVFEPGQHPPAWATFGNIKDVWTDAEFVAARRLSESRPFVWLLEIGGREPVTWPIGPHAARIRQRLIDTGLRPYVVGVMYFEEWYEHWLSGKWTDIGLPPSHPAGVDIIRDWTGRQHAALKAELGLPVIWMTTVANNDPRLQPYRPVPANVDYVAIDAYVGVGRSFATDVMPVLAHAEHTTHLPLLMVTQWFVENRPESPWRFEPNPNDVVNYLAWAQRPRWVATMGFLWSSSPHDRLVGLADLPVTRSLIERALGVPQ